MEAFRFIPPPTAAAILNTCAVPLRRRMVNGALTWCEHRWWLIMRPVAKGERVVLCEHCLHSISVRKGFLKGAREGRQKNSLTAPNITGTGT